MGTVLQNIAITFIVIMLGVNFIVDIDKTKNLSNRIGNIVEGIGERDISIVETGKDIEELDNRLREVEEIVTGFSGKKIGDKLNDIYTRVDRLEYEAYKEENQEMKKVLKEYYGEGFNFYLTKYKPHSGDGFYEVEDTENYGYFNVMVRGDKIIKQ